MNLELRDNLLAIDALFDINTGTFTDGGVLVGNGSGVIQALAVLADGDIHIGDGAADPAVLAAFTSATGTLKHESGGLEFDANGITTGGLIKGSSAGVMAILARGSALEVLRVNAGATDLEYAAVGAANHEIVRKTADESVDNSLTMQNDDHFSFAIGASEVWMVELCLIVSGTDTGGLDITWSLPTGGQYASRHIGAEGLQTDSGVVVGGSSSALLASGAEVRVVADAATVDIVSVIMKFLIVNSTTGGTAQFQWAQASNVVGPTTIHSESYMIGHQL